MDNRELKIQVSPLGPSFVDKRDASKNPALWCGIFAHKERVLLQNKIIRRDWRNLDAQNNAVKMQKRRFWNILAIFWT
jgi:hypothetical protein